MARKVALVFNNVSYRIHAVLLIPYEYIFAQSWKKCAKSTILNMKVRIRKFKCHQKIPWIRFAGNDISNYCLILNRNGARD
jgi:hypothetical protein